MQGSAWGSLRQSEPSLKQLPSPLKPWTPRRGARGNRDDSSRPLRQPLAEGLLLLELHLLGDGERSTAVRREGERRCDLHLAGRKQLPLRLPRGLDPQRDRSGDDRLGAWFFATANNFRKQVANPGPFASHCQDARVRERDVRGCVALLLVPGDAGDRDRVGRNKC